MIGNMNYLLTPLHVHPDLGFGATADSYKDAADYLEENSQRNHFNGHLPINFLRRHAAELYLKSAIIIFHRVLQLPFGPSPWDADPMVLERKGSLASNVQDTQHPNSARLLCRVVQQPSGFSGCQYPDELGFSIGDGRPD